VSPSTRVSRRPKGLRRLERWWVGVVMGIVAFSLEKIVMRSVNKKGTKEPEPVATTVTSKGSEVDL
jgi:hypothetical protein